MIPLAADPSATPVIFPGCIDDGGTGPVVFRLDDGRECRADGGHARAVIVYGCRCSRVRAWQNDRPYRIGALETGHMNLVSDAVIVALPLACIRSPIC